jgi:1,4-dihydroxy-2-naphthoate octaprenyltransferase
VQGVCADCWGSKGGRQLWAGKSPQGWPAALSPIVVGALAAALPIAIVVLLWILD